MAEQGLWVMPKRTVLAVALHGIKRISLEIFVISVSSSVTFCLQGTCFWIMLSLSHSHFSWSVKWNSKVGGFLKFCSVEIYARQLFHTALKP